MSNPQNTPPHSPPGDFCGMLVVDKPLGWSSMDVIRKVRWAARMKRVGHAGTLDPLATGVVVVCLGKATKSVDLLMGMTKVYEAKVDFSAFTTTDDREGPRTEVDVPVPPDTATIERAIKGFIGEIDQTPPAFSAIHVDGQRAYKLARAGEEVVLKSRKVRIDAVELRSYAWPLADLRIVCGKGTYIRSLARDLGKALGTGGHLAALRRTAVGDYDISKAVSGDGLTREIIELNLLKIDTAK